MAATRKDGTIPTGVASVPVCWPSLGEPAVSTTRVQGPAPFGGAASVGSAGRSASRAAINAAPMTTGHDDLARDKGRTSPTTTSTAIASTIAAAR